MTERLCAELRRARGQPPPTGRAESSFARAALHGRRLLFVGDLNTAAQYGALGCYLAGAAGLRLEVEEGPLGEHLPDGAWHSFTAPQLGNATVGLLRVSVLLGDWPATVTDWAAWWRPDVVVAAAHTRLSVPPSLSSRMKPDIGSFLRAGEPEEEGLLRLGAQSMINLAEALDRGLNRPPAVVWRGAPPRHSGLSALAEEEDHIRARLARLNDLAEARCAELGWHYLDVWELSDEAGWHVPKSTINYAYPGMPDAWNVRLLEALARRQGSGGEWGAQEGAGSRSDAL